MSISRASSSSNSYALSRWKYDVFLSFRGEDTGNSFTDHLYAAFNQKGIYVFRDDIEHLRGQSISLEILRAIEESRFLLLILSKNYAHSTWCLDELVKIIECNQRSEQQIVIPIYYDVEPSIVRKQKGYFGEAFAKHEEVFSNNIEKVQRWRDALKEVTNLSGWELRNRNESELIEDIVKEISNKLIPTEFENNIEGLVGIDLRCNKLMRLLHLESHDDIRRIGICGMGGLGKTTIARVVYDLISYKFEASSFLANVNKISENNNLIYLQRQLLSELLKITDISIWNVYDGINMIGRRLRRKRILLVIDDVADVEELDSLAGKRDWFGSGSRIIITSRDKHILKLYGVDEVYEPEKLNEDEALRLFCRRTFKADQPMEGYEKLSKDFVNYADGLPSTINNLSSFLFDKTQDEWKSYLDVFSTDKVNLEMTVVIINFVMELPSAAFDQLSSVHKPHYALASMSMSFAAMLMCIIQLVHKCRKRKVAWKWKRATPWLYYQLKGHDKPFGNFKDIIGLVCAICQCIFAAINFYFVHRHADNPVKVSFWPIVFALGLLCSKLSEKPKRSNLLIASSKRPHSLEDIM